MIGHVSLSEDEYVIFMGIFFPTLDLFCFKIILLFVLVMVVDLLFLHIPDGGTWPQRWTCQDTGHRDWASSRSGCGIGANTAVSSRFAYVIDGRD